MRYQKGSFIVVPNQDALKGIHPVAQCLYMWLCFHANQQGECYPSRQLLAREVGVSDRTIDQHLKALVECGLIMKQARFKGNEKQSNLYVIPLSVEGGSEKSSPPSEISSQGGSEKSSHRTQSNTELNPVNSTPEAGEDTAHPVNDFINLFMKLDPAAARLFRRPPQRAAAARLLQLHEISWWERFMEAYAERITDQYCPKATTPIQMEEKLAAITAYAGKLKRSQVIRKREVIL